MRKPKPIPDVDYLNECFDYYPETGALLWRSRPLSHFKGTYGLHIFEANYAGRQAFTSISAGYYNGAINGVHYKAHRIIWKLMTGQDPLVVDHINGIRTDNRFCNLRATDPAGNAHNARLRHDSKSGLKGVTWCNTNEKWMAQIRINTKTKFLGHFVDKHSAHAAYRLAAVAYHGEFANFG